MIDTLETQLAEWIVSVVGTLPIAFSMPDAAPTDKRVVLHLLSFAETPPASTGHLAPLQVTLRYLVMAWAETTEEAHTLLGELLFAAMADDSYEVELESLPGDMWLAFGLPPQPTFVLRALLRKPRTEGLAARVRQPLVLKAHPMTDLFGVVLGPEDVPITNARLQVHNDPRYAYSDNRGRFVIPNLPAGEPVQLRVSAKGRRFDVKLEPGASPDEPAEIHIDFD